MVISTQHRFIFIHVNRTGGGSISQTLRPFGTNPPRTRLRRMLTRYGLIRDPNKAFFPSHLTAHCLRGRLPKGLYDSYITACFVRNPFSWVAALYNAIQKSDGHRHQARVAGMSFAQYVDWEIARHKRSLSAYMTDKDGSIMVDFVGRFENLHLDFERLCALFGLPALELLHAKTLRPHEDYRSYYDDATREKVARHWKADIDRFGYTFDGLIDPDPNRDVAPGFSLRKRPTDGSLCRQETPVVKP